MSVLSETWTVYSHDGRLKIQTYYWLIYLTQLATNKSHDNPIQIQCTKSRAMEVRSVIIWLTVGKNFKARKLVWYFWCTIPNLWGRVKVYETNPFFVNGIWPWPSGLFWLAVKKLKMDEIESWSTEILIIRLTEQDIGCIGFRVSTSLLIWYIFECGWNCKTALPKRFNLYFTTNFDPKTSTQKENEVNSEIFGKVTTSNIEIFGVFLVVEERYFQWDFELLEWHFNLYSHLPFYETVDKMTVHCIKTYWIQFHLSLY